MTIEEAIKNEEEIAKENEELYRLCPASESDMFHCDGTKDCKSLKDGKNKGCQKCADEHKQLAEWLKELQAYKNNLTNQSLSDALVHSENENERLHDRTNDLSKEVQAHREAWDKCIKEIEEWYWNADKQAIAKDPCVVDAMVDLFIRTVKECKPKAGGVECQEKNV